MHCNRFGRYFFTLFVVSLVFALSTVAQACCACDHPDMVRYGGWRKTWAPVDSKYHVEQVYTKGRCYQCDTLNGFSFECCFPSNGEKEEHRFLLDAVWCAVCDYEKHLDCQHINKTSHYDATIPPIYSNLSASQHNVQYGYKIVCDDCGAATGETGYSPAIAEPHSVPNDRCACVYVIDTNVRKIIREEFEIISSGSGFSYDTWENGVPFSIDAGEGIKEIKGIGMCPLPVWRMRSRQSAYSIIAIKIPDGAMCFETIMALDVYCGEVEEENSEFHIYVDDMLVEKYFVTDKHQVKKASILLPADAEVVKLAVHQEHFFGNAITGEERCIWGEPVFILSNDKEEDAFLKVDAGHENGLLADATGGRGMNINVTSNVAWNVKVTQGNDWITLSTTAGNGNGAFYTTITANIGAERRGTIEVSANGCETITIPVVQNGAQVLPGPTVQGATEVVANETVTYQVHADGAVRYIQYLNGKKINEFTANAGITQIPLTYIQAGRFVLQFSAVSASGAESEKSERLLVTVKAGKAPVLEAPSVQGATEVSINEAVTYQVHTEGAMRYIQYLNGKKTNEYAANEGVTQIPLTYLQKGRFVLQFSAVNANGIESKKSEKLIVSVKESAVTPPDAPMVTADKKEVSVGENVRFTITAEPGTTINMYHNNKLVAMAEDSVIVGSSGQIEVDYAFESKARMYVTFTAAKDSVESAASKGVAVVVADKKTYEDLLVGESALTASLQDGPVLNASPTPIAGEYAMWYRFDSDDPVDNNRTSDVLRFAAAGIEGKKITLWGVPLNSSMTWAQPNNRDKYQFWVTDYDNILDLEAHAFSGEFTGRIGSALVNIYDIVNKKVICGVTIVVEDQYVYGYQLNYPENSNYYNKRTLWTTKAQLAWRYGAGIRMKQIWFELNLGEHMPLPTFEFEKYNDEWWRHQKDKYNRSAAIFFDNTIGNLWELCVNTLDNAVSGLYWTITTVVDDEHLARSDKLSAAKIIIDGWIEEIDAGVIEISHRDDWEKLSKAEVDLINAQSITEKLEAIETCNLYIKALPIPGADTILEIIEKLTTTLKGGNDIQVSELVRVIEKCKAEVIIEVLKEQSLNEGLDEDMRKTVKVLLDDSTNIFLETVWKTGDFVNGFIGTLLELIGGGAADVVTGGITSGVQFGVSAAIEVNGGKHFEEINQYGNTLEGAVKVFLTKTKPQATNSIKAYAENPNHDNYHEMRNPDYSGKLQMWYMQCKQLCKIYWTICGLAEGDEDKYADELAEELELLNQTYRNITHVNWGDTIH